MPPLVRQQSGEVERSVGVAALVGASVGGFGTCNVAPLLEQHTQVRRRSRMPAPVGASEDLLRLTQIAALREQSS
jgi:hypothetical protein